MYRTIALTALVALTSCGDISTVSRNSAPGLYTPALAAPADARPGTCWDKTETPALIQTVTEDVLVQPAQISSTGTIQAPPVYRSQTRQVILQERQVRWFELVCAKDITPEFLSSLQRALAARGLYNGPVTGVFDAATAEGVRAFQRGENVSARIHTTLTVEGARKLGLWVVDIPGRNQG